MENNIWQMFISGYGEYLEPALQKGLGGVILFSKDIKTEKELRENILRIKNKSAITPFVAIDQEGGRVERTESIRSKRLSPRFAFQKGEEYLRAQSEEIAKELRDWGFNLNFAPCVDVNTNSNNPIIGERAFSDEPDGVIKGADIFVEAMRKYGIIPCIKHYPGHGDADMDSHLTLPKIDLTLEEMENTHIKPFKHEISKDIEMIMAAHIHCTCFDKESLPSSLSCNAIGYLRNKLHYEGIIISDDMVMKGVQKYESAEALIMGLKAGLDMFIFRETDEKTYQIIEEFVNRVLTNNVLMDLVMCSNERIVKLKHRAGLV